MEDPVMSTEIIIGTACVVALTLLWRFIRCPHAWDLIDKTEFPPTLDDYVRNGGVRLHSGYLSKDAIERMSSRTVVLALRCPKCGTAMIKKIKGSFDG